MRCFRIFVLFVTCFVPRIICNKYSNRVRDRYIDFISHRVGLIEEGMHNFVYEAKPKIGSLQDDVDTIKAENKKLNEKVEQQEQLIKSLQWATADIKKYEVTKEEIDFITELKWTIFDLKFANQELQEDACLRSTQCFQWTGWSACSSECGKGTQKRSRACVTTGRFSSMCKPVASEEQKCEGTDCAADSGAPLITASAPTETVKPTTPQPITTTTENPTTESLVMRTTDMPEPTTQIPSTTSELPSTQKSAPVVPLKPLKLQTCPSGYTSYQGYCFRFSNRQDARLVSTINCDKEGAHLVEINSKEKQKIVFDYVSEVAPKYMVDMYEDFSKREYWDYKDIDRKTHLAIDGIRRHQDTRYMSWKNNVMTYFNWRIGQPRNDKSDGSYCIVMNVLTGEWYLKCCSVTFFYICEASTALALN